MLHQVVFLFLSLSFLCFASEMPESYWHKSFNDQVIHGRTEVLCNSGIVDIVSDEFAIEVESIKKWSEGLAQAKKYSVALSLKPGLALFSNGVFPKELHHQIDSICYDQKIRLWVINEYVGPPEEKVAATPARVYAAPVKRVTEEIVSFNTNSYKYHCTSCRAALRCTKSCIDIPRSQAIGRGGIPCLICGGTCR